MPQFSLANDAKKDGASIYADGATAEAVLEGVQVFESRHVLVANGSLVELFRRDWWGGSATCNVTIDQLFLRHLRAGEASGWHVHANTTDRLAVISGKMKVTLFDDRPSSPSFRQSQVLFLGAARPQLLVIPPGIWHATRAEQHSDSCVINLVDVAYQYQSPDHFRLPIDTALIPVVA